MYLSRREFVQYAAVTGLAAPLSAAGLAAQPAPAGRTPASRYAPPPPFELEEITIHELQDGLKSGKYTSRRLCTAYLARIQQIDGAGPTLKSVIETNPDALALADAADAERKAGKVRGPLHGIPVLIKDNIATGDKMRTTAGSLALADAPAPRDSTVAKRLRDAGAIIIGKTNLSEWANFRSTHSVSGWSGRGGLCKNPYALDRNACGSSSGTGAAISANLAAVGVGSETDGSIVCPSGANSLVGIKPTLGLVSRRGIVPISHTQDTAGPMARTVADAAALLGVLAGVDPDDAATAAAGGHIEADYTKFLDPSGLKGARIGVARAKFFGYSSVTDKLVSAAIDAMKQAGAVIVDPADIPHAGEYDDAEFTVLLYEFKADLNAYLAGLGAQAPNKTLADLIAWNDRNHDRELAYFGQEIFAMAQDKGPLTDDAYIEALAHCRRLSRTEGLDPVFAKEKLDALVAPTGSPAWTTDLVNGDHFLGASSTPAAVAGYASISVPVGYVHGLPVGMSFIGTAWSEPTLIRLAYAYEQAVKPRRAPRFLPTADLSTS
ncbi:MAG TPA: amidase [Gemmatimonadales bacterium]|nr:amidase [Gemmatimonadales bacterium]